MTFKDRFGFPQKGSRGQRSQKFSWDLNPRSHWYTDPLPRDI